MVLNLFKFILNRSVEWSAVQVQKGINKDGLKRNWLNLTGYDRKIVKRTAPMLAELGFI